MRECGNGGIQRVPFPAIPHSRFLAFSLVMHVHSYARMQGNARQARKREERERMECREYPVTIHTHHVCRVRRESEWKGMQGNAQQWKQGKSEGNGKDGCKGMHGISSGLISHV